VTAAELVRHRLLEITDVTDLVSTRVYTLLVRPGTTMPCVRVQTISDTEPMHLRGSSGLHQARVQVDAMASVKDGGDALADARDVAEAAHGPGDATGLCGFAGTVNGSPGVEILAIRPIGGPVELYHGEEQEYVTVTRDYAVDYRSH